MAREESAKIVEQMLDDFSKFSVILGGLEFYGYSTDFRDFIDSCREFISPSKEEGAAMRKVYLFLEPFHGKSAISKAMEIEAKANGFATFRFDGTLGPSQRELRDLQPRTDTLVIVDGLPEVAGNRRVILDRFNALSGHGILLARSDYAADANLNPVFTRFVLRHVDHRPIDKLAWLVGLVRENLRDEAGVIAADLDKSLKQLPVKTLVALSHVPLGERVRELPTLGRRVAETLRLQVELHPSEALPQEDLAVIFMELYSAAVVHKGYGFRLWVEGDSDWRLFKLVSKLAKEAKGIDLEEGLSILPLGRDREGGTSRALTVVLSEQTRRNKDIFLLDFDEPGRHAQEELEVLQQDVVLLDPKLSCSRSHSEVEIEDFISLRCLDRFYEAHPELRPEIETIRYRIPATRRVVVNGEDKETLANWLEGNASLSDLENLFFVLSDIRSRFSLRNFLPSSEIRSWRKKLEEETDVDKHFGARPEHWAAR